MNAITDVATRPPGQSLRSLSWTGSELHTREHEGVATRRPPGSPLPVHPSRAAHPAAAGGNVGCGVQPKPEAKGFRPSRLSQEAVPQRPAQGEQPHGHDRGALTSECGFRVTTMIHLTTAAVAAWRVLRAQLGERRFCAPFPSVRGGGIRRDIRAGAVSPRRRDARSCTGDREQITRAPFPMWLSQRDLLRNHYRTPSVRAAADAGSAAGENARTRERAMWRAVDCTFITPLPSRQARQGMERDP